LIRAAQIEGTLFEHVGFSHSIKGMLTDPGRRHSAESGRGHSWVANFHLRLSTKAVLPASKTPADWRDAVMLAQRRPRGAAWAQVRSSTILKFLHMAREALVTNRTATKVVTVEIIAIAVALLLNDNWAECGFTASDRRVTSPSDDDDYSAQTIDKFSGSGNGTFPACDRGKLRHAAVFRHQLG
jgi:hypothetical protein